MCVHWTPTPCSYQASACSTTKPHFQCQHLILRNLQIRDFTLCCDIGSVTHETLFPQASLPLSRFPSTGSFQPFKWAVFILKACVVRTEVVMIGSLWDLSRQRKILFSSYSSIDRNNGLVRKWRKKCWLLLKQQKEWQQEAGRRSPLTSYKK